MTQPKRVEWVDVLKGLAIIFVVLGHLPGDPYIKQWIYSFHMPLFFMASGIFISSALKYQFTEFACKRFNRLMIPYYFYGFLLCIPFYIFIDYLRVHLEGEVATYDILGHIIGQLFAIRQLIVGDTYITCHIWFLPCLFSALIIICRCLKFTNYKKILLICVLTLIGVGMNFWGVGMAIPFCIDMALIALPFILLGTLCLKHSDKITALLAIAFLIVGSAIGICNGTTDMYAGQLGHSVIAFFISAITLSVFFIWLSIKLTAFKSTKPIKFLEKCGRNSLLIYILHLPLIYPYGYLIAHMPGATITGVSNLYSILAAIITLAIIFPLSTFIEKFMPWSIGNIKR
ncbi:MAG: acyltransferase family protein [Bacteroides sp.]|nr:acyltransferase family protein [Bacteroides sp.]MCM1378738.1 acyltransferase family protein [Bacteroides sp.]MCM1445355.1 acyltransferase family protein [Prevotella sp.]